MEFEHSTFPRFRNVGDCKLPVIKTVVGMSVRFALCRLALLALFACVPFGYQAYPQRILETKPQTLSAKEIARRTLPSVVLVVSDSPKTEGFSQGSGFLVRPGIVVTNYHVIKGDTRGFVQVAVGPDNKKLNLRIARVISFDEESDLAILSVPAAKAAKIPSLTMETNLNPTQIGESIYALGNPEGMVGTISPGIVSANIRSTQKKARIQITAPISHGSSGGPIVNEQGKVVGVAVGSIAAGQNLNFAIPVSLVESLLSTAQMPRSGDDLMDTLADKDAKSPAPWSWTVPELTTTSLKSMPSIIGPLRSGETDEIASLRKLSGVYLLIEDLNPATNEIITESQIRTGTELRLRQSGIRILTFAERMAAPGSPMLYVQVSSLKDENLYTYRYTVELYQDVLLGRDTNFRLQAVTWETGTYGYAGSSVVRTTLTRNIFNAVDEFCNDFLKANEK